MYESVCRWTATGDLECGPIHNAERQPEINVTMKNEPRPGVSGGVFVRECLEAPIVEYPSKLPDCVTYCNGRAHCISYQRNEGNCS